MRSEPAREVLVPGESEPLEALLDRAIRGDAESLDVFFTLLKTRYGSLVFTRLGRQRHGAHTATLEDVFQQGMLSFMQEIRDGALPELPPGQVRDILAHFQKHCDRKLQAHRANRRAPEARENIEFHVNITRNHRIKAPARSPDDEEAKERHLALLRLAMSNLAPFDKGVLEGHASGASYEELARRTGRTVTALQVLVSRLRQHLAAELSRVSDTARLAQQARKQVPAQAQNRSLCPAAAEIHAAIRRLPKEAQEAVSFVHLEGGTPEELAGHLGERGLEKAVARLNRAYESLAARLRLPFPESFTLLRAAPDA